MTVLGSEVALLGGILSIVFAFAQTDTPTLLNLGTGAATIMFAVGLVMLSRNAGRRASAGFLAFAAGVVTLTAAYTTVDPLAISGSAWVPLDASLVLVGDVAALVGGVLLGISLGPLAGGSGLGKGAAYAFLAGGILQMLAGMADVPGIITGSADLGNIGHVLDGLSGIVYVAVAPALLVIVVRRLRARTPQQGP